MNEENNTILKVDRSVTPDHVLFFDMDGTLIDTDYANFLSYKKAVELVTKNELEFSYSPIQRFNRNLLKTTIPNLTEKEASRIIIEKEKYYNDFLYETQLNNEIAEILYKYSKTNKTVLVTNCREDRALSTLNHHQLTDKFSNLFFRQFDEKRKINKFQNAILRLGISPNLIIAFENEKDEIADAMEAGIQNINHLNI